MSRVVRTAGNATASRPVRRIARGIVEAPLRPHRPDQFRSPAAEPNDRRIGGEQRPRVGLEKAT